MDPAILSESDLRHRVGSIEVVSPTQFAMLYKAVQDLMTLAGPVPMPALPDNEKLRKDLAAGTASLTDTMQAMQVLSLYEKKISRHAIIKMWRVSITS